MPADRQARSELLSALVRYMTGEIQSFEFDDEISCRGSENATNDMSAQQISGFLFHIHDDFIDHCVSASPHCWAALRRIVAFLCTDLDIESTPEHVAWPFRNEEEWLQNEWRLNQMDLPQYDSAIHGRQVNPWWSRIPSSLGFTVIGVVLAVILTLFFMMR